MLKCLHNFNSVSVFISGKKKKETGILFTKEPLSLLIFSLPDKTKRQRSASLFRDALYELKQVSQNVNPLEQSNKKLVRSFCLHSSKMYQVNWSSTESLKIEELEMLW